MASDRDLSRRKFLARAGVLGAVAGAGATGGLALGGGPAGAQLLPLPLSTSELVKRLRPVLAELSRDTFNGLTTFVVPGPDAYSQAQGTPRSEPGALEADATGFIIDALDSFVPFPEELARTLTDALTSAVSGLGIELPRTLLDLLLVPISSLDEALGKLLQSDGAIPLSLAVAMLLNLAATQANPAAVEGPFLSPFARLSFEDKARAFELLEGPDPDLVGALDSELPEPLRSSLSGLLRFVSGALLEFSAFGAYNEWAVFDARTKTLQQTPVGWRLTGYPGVSDGRDDLIGYYQNRTEVDTNA